MSTTFVGSPNFTPGRLGNPVLGVIVHHSEAEAATVDAIFTNPDPNQPGGRRSTHYLVCRDGSIRQYVHEYDTAWGAGNWQANLEYVNIEFEEVGEDYTDTQYASGNQLIHEIAARQGFAVSDQTVLPHKHFKATACPGSLEIPRLVQGAQLVGVDEPVTPGIPATDTSASMGHSNGPVTVHAFPKLVQVTVPLRVRSTPSLSAAIIRQPTPSGVLTPPYAFEALDCEHGDSYTINGVSSDLWLKTPRGHWVAAGGTDYQPNSLS